MPQSFNISSNRILFRVCSIIIFLGLALTFNYFLDRAEKSIPEYEFSENSVRGNSNVLAIYGKINEINCTHSQIITHGASRSGYYEFEVTGDKMQGLLRIDWQDVQGRFIPVEIDQINSDSESNIIWKN